MNIGIIGAGVHGAATAYFLDRLGDNTIRVFEKDHIGSGSTGFSAGIVRFHYSNETHVSLVRRGWEIIRHLDEYVGQDAGFHENGYLVLYDGDGEGKLREIVSTQRKNGIEVDLVGPDDVRTYFPEMNPDGIARGAYEHRAGFADPHLTTTGFASKAREEGVEFLTGTRVDGFERTDGHVERLITNRGEFDVDFVVNAAGAHGARIARMAGVSVPYEICESKIVVLNSDPPYGLDRPTVSDHSMESEFYMKPEPTGNFLVGGIDRPSVDPERGKQGIDEQFLLEVSDRLERRVPKLADASVVNSWSGRISVTPDSYQIVGIPEGMENFYNLIGGSGHGFKSAPAFAEAVAKDILGREPGFDLSQYRLERFREGDLLLGVSSETYGSDNYTD